MLKLRTKWFTKWAKKNQIFDKLLLKTIEVISDNLNAVNLGSGLYKVRVPKTGQGKSGGYRILIVYKKMEKTIFVYGFAKTEKENLDQKELTDFKKLAKDLLHISSKGFIHLIKLGNFIKLEKTK